MRWPGLTPVTAPAPPQHNPGLPPDQTGDRFGAALAVADVDHAGRDDLIAGAPGEAIGTRAGAGAAAVLFGGPGLLDAEGAGRSVGLHQNTPCVPGVAETGEREDAADGPLHGPADLRVQPERSVEEQ